jgi:hypothetical protein
MTIISAVFIVRSDDRALALSCWRLVSRAVEIANAKGGRVHAKSSLNFTRSRLDGFEGYIFPNLNDHFPFGADGE